MSESTGFSAAEQAAIAERAQELRAQRGGRKKADALQDLLVKIEEMPEQDRAMAVGVHRIVTEAARSSNPAPGTACPPTRAARTCSCSCRSAASSACGTQPSADVRRRVVTTRRVAHAEAA